MDIPQPPVTEEQREQFQAHPFRADMRILFLGALIVFIITVIIGLINGQRLLKLSQDVLLTHVHAGTIGWITLSVFALSLWLFKESGTAPTPNPLIRWSSIAGAVFIPLYVLAFLSGIPIARVTLGIPTWIVMAIFFVWIVYRSTRLRLGVAQLAILASLFTLVLGGLLGVLLQFEFATSSVFLPQGAFGAHPAGLVTGYLVLIGMALSEWRLRPAHIHGGAPRLGVIQISLFFLSGIVIAIATLFNLTPLYGLNTLLLVVGGVIYIIRFAPYVARTHWTGRNSGRFFALSGVFIVVQVILTIYLTVLAIANGSVPAGSGLLIALDHAVFIGIMTNALFGLLREVTAEREAVLSWAEDVVFWGMNIGLIGFLFALLSNIRDLERIFTPIMGLAILLAIGLFIARILPSRSLSVPAVDRASTSGQTL